MTSWVLWSGHIICRFVECYWWYIDYNSSTPVCPQIFMLSAFCTRNGQPLLLLGQTWLFVRPTFREFCSPGLIKHLSTISFDWTRVLARFRGSKWELIYESMNPIGHFSRTPWAGDRPIARPPHTQDNKTHKNVDIYIYIYIYICACFERDSKPR
jgi:hypothetical protein